MSEALKGECVEYSGYRNKGGYGVEKNKGKRGLAHRVAWIAANGPIPKSMEVCHACDNPPCIFLGHLFLGTKQENRADCVRKNRHAQGSKHGRSKLSESDVIEIRKLHRPGFGRSLAIKYGVHKTIIDRIVRRSLWRNI